MKEIKIYTTETCPYCISAKNLLKSLNVPYKEIMLEFGSDELRNLIKKTKFRTVPQIFIGEKMIGGYNELREIVDEDEFFKLIK